MMTTLVIDTDVLIELSRNNLAVAELLNGYQQQGYQLSISVVTKYELVIGAFNKQDLAKTLKFLNARFHQFTLNDRIAYIADDLLVKYALSHGLKIADALIAATAIYHHYPLLSRNQKDFRYIDNLVLWDYPI